MGFINNTDELLVFVGCVSGIFGSILVLAAIFFIADKLELFKQKHKPNLSEKTYGKAEQNGFQKNLQNPKHPKDDPMWFYNNTTPIPKVTSTVENDKYNTMDAYINDAFSDIILENDENHKTKVAYENHDDKEIPEKSKPSKLLEYNKRESKKLKRKESKEKRMIGLERETKKETGECYSKNFTMIAVEVGNKREESPDFREEEDESKMKIMLSLESEKTEKKIKEDKSQLLHYENPKNATRERQIQDEQRKEEEHKRKSKKIKMVPVQSNFSFGKPNMVTRQESKVQRRIII